MIGRRRLISAHPSAVCKASHLAAVPE